MPTSSGRSYHAQLTANTVMPVTLDADYSSVEVLHRDSSATDPIYFTTTGAPNPTVGGDGTYVVMPGQSLIVTDPNIGGAAAMTVHLISASGVHFSVTGTNN